MFQRAISPEHGQEIGAFGHFGAFWLAVAAHCPPSTWCRLASLPSPCFLRPLCPRCPRLAALAALASLPSPPCPRLAAHASCCHPLDRLPSPRCYDPARVALLASRRSRRLAPVASLPSPRCPRLTVLASLCSPRRPHLATLIMPGSPGAARFVSNAGTPAPGGQLTAIGEEGSEQFLDLCGRALDSARGRACPSLRWVLASQPGSEDLPEGREQWCASRCARLLTFTWPRPPAHVPPCSLCLPHSSGRHLRAIGSHGDILVGPCVAQSADAVGTCMLVYIVRAAASACTDCDPTLVPCRFHMHVCRVTRTQNSGPFWGPRQRSRILGCFGEVECVELTCHGHLDV